MQRKVDFSIEEVIWQYGLIYVVHVGNEKGRAVFPGGKMRIPLSDEVTLEVSLLKEEERIHDAQNNDKTP